MAGYNGVQDNVNGEYTRGVDPKGNTRIGQPLLPFKQIGGNHRPPVSESAYEGGYEGDDDEEVTEATDKIMWRQFVVGLISLLRDREARRLSTGFELRFLVLGGALQQDLFGHKITMVEIAYHHDLFRF